MYVCIIYTGKDLGLQNAWLEEGYVLTAQKEWSPSMLNYLLLLCLSAVEWIFVKKRKKKEKISQKQASTLAFYLFIFFNF